MQIHYLQEVKVKNYALIGKLWGANGWFEFGGVIGTRRDGKECFSRVELTPGDRIYMAPNKQPRSLMSPKFLIFVKKGKRLPVRKDLSKS